MYNFVFCGNSQLSLGCLDALYSQNIMPSIVITSVDKPAGRGLELHESVVATWVNAKNIELESKNLSKVLLLKPLKISEITDIIKDENAKKAFDFCLVVSNGKILPKDFLDIFNSKVLNIHPSDLPLYRGPSPLESQILDGLQNIIVSIMQIDEEIDHGSVLHKNCLDISNFKNIDKIEYAAGKLGGESLCSILNNYINNKIIMQLQEHARATFTKKFKKEDGDVTLDIENNNLEKIYRKFIAFTPWPSVYFFIKKDDKKIRVKITDMSYDAATNIYKIEKVIEEGKKEKVFN